MLTRPYASLDALKRRMQISNDDIDADLHAVLMAASESISNDTGRRFEPENSTEARTFQANGPGWRCFINDLDIADTSGTEYEPTVTWTTGGRSGTYEAQQGDVILRKVRRSTVVDLIEADRFPFPVGRGCWVKIAPSSSSIGWGWGTVPAPVVEATLLLANRFYKRRNSPDGMAGFEGAGVGRIARTDPDVAQLIGRYNRIDKWVA